MKPLAGLSQVVLVDAAFAHRGDPLTKSPNLKPAPQQIRVEMDMSAFTEQGATAVRLRVISNPEEEGALYQFAVQMAAILTRSDDTPKEWTERDFAKIGATMLFPFVREVVANITGRGRFGPVWLNPFNVEEFFRQPNQDAQAVADIEQKSPNVVMT